MKIIFFGTTDFAVESLDQILKSGHEVAAVVTAENKLGGRGRKELIKSAVCVYAEENGLKLLQPKALKGPKFLEKISKFKADLFVVVAFRMMPEVLWSMPPKGTINLHGSLLPAYRGAAPINWAIINGEKVSGATVFFLDQKIDTGKIVLREELKIEDDETFGSYYDRLKVAGAKTLVNAIEIIATEPITALPQDESKASHAPKLDKENTKINFDLDASDIINLCRGLNPFPGAWFIFEEKVMKVFRCQIHTDAPGPDQWVSDYKSYLRVGCKDYSVELLEIQPEGKKRMSTKEYLNGSGQKLKAARE